METQVKDRDSIGVAYAVLFLLIVIGMWSVAGSFFYEQARSSPSPFHAVSAEQIITHMPRQA